MVRWIPFPTRLRRLREEVLLWDKTMELPVKRKRKRNSSHSHSSRGVLHLEWDSSVCSSSRNNPVDSTPDNNSRASSHSRKLDNSHGVQPNKSNLRLGINPSSSSNSSKICQPKLVSHRRNNNLLRSQKSRRGSSSSSLRALVLHLNGNRSSSSSSSSNLHSSRGNLSGYSLLRGLSNLRRDRDHHRDGKGNRHRHQRSSSSNSSRDHLPDGKDSRLSSNNHRNNSRSSQDNNLRNSRRGRDLREERTAVVLRKGPEEGTECHRRNRDRGTREDLLRSNIPVNTLPSSSRSSNSSILVRRNIPGNNLHRGTMEEVHLLPEVVAWGPSRQDREQAR